jgi:16S rRNA (guanine527-N7)-methyltransferase
MSGLVAGRLASKYELEPRQVAQLEALLETLAGDEHAPTAVREIERAVDIHLADSLTAIDLDGIRAARRIADLGAGAGFPGLALAVAFPDAEVALVESQRRKCEFLRRASAASGIANVRVVCARAEDWSDGLGANDAVVARALASQPVVLEYAAPLLRLGGTLVDWRGTRNGEEEQVALRAAEELGLAPVEIRHVEPFAAARDHHLHVFTKVADTPERFPRRPGMASKRPLGI